jgi:hypothetical protein
MALMLPNYPLCCLSGDSAMPDVFISYSRKDSDFVKQVFDALKAHQREAWIDWQGIDYSSKWWEEICAGIEGSDHFVLIISPDSLNSVYCHREIEHASKHKKRIIPVLYRPIDEGDTVGHWYTDPTLRPIEGLARANWETVKSIQWIDYAKLGGFEPFIDKLLQTIDTDPERVRQHTRLLLRIKDWEGRGRSPIRLCRQMSNGTISRKAPVSRMKRAPSNWRAKPRMNARSRN